MTTKYSKAFFSLFLLVVSWQLNAQKLTIKVNEPTVELSPYLYGLFFEDINYGADGGLYAELVQNRSFEYFPVRGTINKDGSRLEPMYAWEKTAVGDVTGEVYVTRTLPLNGNNLNNLEIHVQNNQGYLGVSNLGYNGIPLHESKKYNFSFYYFIEKHRNNKDTIHQLKAYLQDENGDILDSVHWNNDELSTSWKKYEHVFTPSKSTEKGRLVVLAHGDSYVKLDMVSLMPQETYNNHKNGLRKDLIEALRDLNPKFLRFPGGCILHGWGLENTYLWKNTLGDVAERKPNWNRWGYHQTNGLGYFEYFQLCEDLGMTPLPVVPLGVSCSFWKFECVAMEHLHETIQDALDLVEFANGPVTSKWGKVRVEMGHPEPFNLKYICLGNEEGDTPEVRERIPEFVKTFNEKYPGIKLIGTSGLTPDVPLYDFMAEQKVWSSDEHYYKNPDWYIENQDRFDNWDRSKPKVFVGEYASNGNTMYNAVAEAIYLMGIERNGDLVEMTCYAPLLARIGNTQWKTDLIYFDNSKIVRTPNYYVQQMFGQNKGDVYLKNSRENWPGKELAVSTTLDKMSNEVIVKIANASNQNYQLGISLEGVKKVAAKGEVTMLSGERNALNELGKPETVIPVVSAINAGTDFNANIPAYSVKVIRVKCK